MLGLRVLWAEISSARACTWAGISTSWPAQLSETPSPVTATRRHDVVVTGPVLPPPLAE